MRNIAKMAMLALAASAALAQDVDTPAAKPAATDNPAATDDKERTADQAEANGDADKLQQFTPPNGYRAQVRDGQTVYCRKEKVLGTRFREEFCFTRLELEDLERRKRSMQNDVARSQRACSTGTACSGGG